jgi:hypothetical protein
LDALGAVACETRWTVVRLLERSSQTLYLRLNPELTSVMKTLFNCLVAQEVSALTRHLVLVTESPLVLRRLNSGFNVANRQMNS